MRVTTVPATYARAFIDFAAARGVNRTALLTRSGIGSRCLDDEARLSVELYASALCAGVELSGDPGLALSFGQEVSTFELSIAAPIVANAGDFETGRREMERYARLVLDDDGAGRIEVVRRSGKLWLTFGTNTYDDYPIILEAGMRSEERR